MIKKEMIANLRYKAAKWGDVYLMFTRIDGEIRPINGWYVASDGPKLSDVYLTNKHPMSDESGEVITMSDCFGE